MGPVEARTTGGRITFLVMTFALSTAVISAMVLVRGSAGTEVTAATRAVASAPVEEPQARKEVAPPQGSGRIVATAQKSEERDLGLPAPPRRGPDPNLGLPNIADIAEGANTSVVSIRAIEIIRPGSQRRRVNPHDPFEFFYPRPDGRGPRTPEEPDDDQRQDSGGSGFVVSDDGFVVTNYHVIEDADRILVKMADDSIEYPAAVVGTDPTTDLALLKIEPRQKIVAITLGDSDRLRVGEWVIAIGNPLDYAHTITVGVVSAKGRKLRGLSRDPSLDNYIQTDAAINRGNSGGPLLNLRGEAVGINSAISVAGQGISFAIPINLARDVLRQLRDTGKVQRGYLGVIIRDIQTELTPEDREYFSLEGRRGAFIQSVTKNEPAEKAGLRKGDAIVAVEGQGIAGSDDLIRSISAKPPGSAVQLGIVRDGRERALTAQLIDRPDRSGADEPADAETAPEDPATETRLGFSVEDLTPDTRQEERVPPDVSGVRVSRVARNSFAWDRDLREGDVILEANRQPVATVAQYRAIVEKLKPGDLLSLYVRSPQESGGRFISLRIGAE